MHIGDKADDIHTETGLMTYTMKTRLIIYTLETRLMTHKHTGDKTEVICIEDKTEDMHTAD